MAVELKEEILRNMTVPPGNIILALDEVTEADERVIEILTKIQEAAEKGKVSFVITGIQAQLAGKFSNHAAERRLNIARVLAEAKDLVMMEQLERELLEGGEG